MQQYMLECPDLFRMGDKYYLTYSWDCVTYYAMSDSMNGPFTAPPDNVLDGNGFIFYAAKTAEPSANQNHIVTPPSVPIIHSDYNRSPNR